MRSRHSDDGDLGVSQELTRTQAQWKPPAPSPWSSPGAGGFPSVPSRAAPHRTPAGGSPPQTEKSPARDGGPGVRAKPDLRVGQIQVAQALPPQLAEAVGRRIAVALS